MMRSMLLWMSLFISFGTTVQAADSSSPPQTPATAATSAADRGKAIAASVCAACHNADGNSTISANPRLSGQHYDYLLKEMKDFKSSARANPVMAGMVANLSEDQMKDLSAWFAAQKPAIDTAKNKATIAQGQKIYRAGNMNTGLPACAACHGPAGAGIPSQYPRIAGQHSEYIETQLKAFRDGTRANDPNKMMRTIALKMTDADIKAVSDYIAGLR
ncbi:MAG TPA: c-type cytochrome [Rhodocyclaceae bacterium]|nr:c-type cytochrome [Rhodocyclaceae bacterium]